MKTNKDYMMEFFPDRVTNRIDVLGGVIGCPEDYGLKNTLRPVVDGKFVNCKNDCTKCWNLILKP